MGKKFVLDQEDGTATNGNLRGDGAVDLQMNRYNSAQVASGVASFVGGGANNRAMGAFAVCAGGDNNSANGLRSFVGGGLNNGAGGQESAIVGGSANQTNGIYNFIGSGTNNIVTDEYGVVVGGSGNSSSSRKGFVGGGTGNTAGGLFNNSVIGGSGSVSSGGESIAGGYQSNASGSRSVAFGLYGTASGGGAFAMGGTASGNGSVAFAGGVSGNTNVFTHGDESSSSLYGSLTKANGRFPSVISNNGRAQTHSVIARREASLTSGSTTILSLDGTGTSNFIDLIGSSVNNGQAFNVKISYIAIVTAISGTATGLNIADVKTQNIEIGIKSVLGFAPILVGSGNYSVAQENSSMNTATLTPSALVNYLNLTFTAPTFVGGGTVTFRVVSQVEIVEVRYGN